MRRLRVLLLVLALGLVGGAATGVLAVALTGLVAGLNTGKLLEPLPPGTWIAFVLGGGIGAAMGLVLAPLLGFSLLRHIPLRRAISGTILGALAGLVISLAIQPLLLFMATPLGAIVAAVLLHEERERARVHAAVVANGNAPPAA